MISQPAVGPDRASARGGPAYAGEALSLRSQERLKLMKILTTHLQGRLAGSKPQRYRLVKA